MIALEDWGAVGLEESFWELAMLSMDGSDGLLEPLLDGETNPVVAYQTHNYKLMN